MTRYREGVWTGHDEGHPPPSPDWRRLAKEGTGLAGGAAALGLLAAPFGSTVPVAAVTMGFGAFGLLGRHADERKRAQREQVQALRDEFGVGPVWTVEMMVRQGDAPTGLDRGLLWVEGGRILFLGFRTSFALSPAQAVGPVRYESALAGVRLRLNLGLRRTTAGGALSISFWPLAGGLQRAENDSSDLRYALNRAIDVPDSLADTMEGQWPPVEIGPHASTPRRLLRGALTRPAAWTVAGATVGSLVAGFAPWVGFGAFAAFAVGANWAIAWENRPRWRAYEDARRVWAQR